MPARDPFSTDDEQRIRATLPSFSRRDQALILLGLHSGFRARELGALTVHSLGTGRTICCAFEN